MDNYRLRILHVSDLHVKAGKEPDQWRRRRVLGEEWNRNLDAIRREGPIDLVCFTGDLAFSGKEEQYASAGRLLEEMLSRIEVPKVPVLRCPREP